MKLPELLSTIEIGVQRARNATAVMFGDKQALTKLASEEFYTTYNFYLSIMDFI